MIELNHKGTEIQKRTDFMKIENFVDRKLIKNIDLGIVLSTILLIIYGFLSISSATHIAGGGSMGMLKIQIIAFILGIIAIYINEI